MIDEKLIKRWIVLKKARERLLHDAEDPDDCRYDGNLSGYIIALEHIIKGETNCPVCWELKDDDIFTHVCYEDEEDHTCYACGEEFEKAGAWKHAQTCKEERY